MILPFAQARTITWESRGLVQKSGIYVRDLTTGEVRLVRGKQSYLVDPRKEIHITRTLSRDDWNLWIMPGEPHKATHIPVTTPWAISIVVPHNTAVLATSAAAQRVIEGPCVALLEYEETLVPLRLSTGTPKDDEDPLVTCYLRTVGNRVSDVLELETADFVRIEIAPAGLLGRGRRPAAPGSVPERAAGAFRERYLTRTTPTMPLLPWTVQM